MHAKEMKNMLYLPTVVRSMLSRRSAIATITRTSFLDSLTSWKWAPILVRDMYSAAFPIVALISTL